MCQVSLVVKYIYVYIIMQDAPLNIGMPIFKIGKNYSYVTIGDMTFW